MKGSTLPKLLLERSVAWPEKTALREKAFGIWSPISWRDYRDRVESLCLGFHALGIRRGDKVAIVGDNRPEWILAELAAQCLGAVPFGIYQDVPKEELSALLEASDARILVAEDQEQVDKALEARDGLRGLEYVVYADTRGMRHYDAPFLLPLSRVASEGQRARAREPEAFEAWVGATDPEDVALLAATSGTTGLPKLAMLTHRNLLSMATSLLEVDPLEPGDELVSFLPLAWVGEQMMAVSSALVAGFTVSFPEEPETVLSDLREIGPHVMFSPPRIWESLLSEVQMKHADASWLKRKMLDWAFDPKRRKGRLAELSCFFWVKDRLGLRRLKRAYTGGAALGPDTLRFFHTLGVNLKQIYGQTEISGISVVHRDGAVKAESMGEPLPGTEILIGPGGEILSRSDAVFKGYYRREAETEAALEGGWLHSGDAGYLDEDGHVVVIDRLADVSHLSDGTPFSPQFVENKLKFSPYVRDAVVFGGGARPYVTALLAIDFQNAGTWAERAGTPFTTFTDLSRHASVRSLLKDEVARVNESLPEPMRVRRFLLLPKELDADDEELTRTRKLRRKVVGERYRPLVEALYRDAEEVSFDTEIAYRDGRRERLSLALLVSRP